MSNIVEGGCYMPHVEGFENSRQVTVTHWKLWLLFLAFFVAGFLLGAGAIGIAIASADPDTTDTTDTIDQPDLNGVVCDQLALGQTPDQIAEQLHRGDLRQSIWSTGQSVRDAISSGC